MAAPTAALFPGQGSSLAGAAELVRSECPLLYERCCELLGADPFERAAESTRFAQPATFLAGIAGFARAAQTEPAPAAFAGHSLGELTALTAAGVWSPEVGLELVVLRARLMAAAGDGADGGMLALLGGDPERVAALAGCFGVTVANDNAPGQMVLSGPRESLGAAAQAAREQGLRAIPLGVSGAFHSPAMAPAAAELGAALSAAGAGAPRAPVYSCLTAAPFTDPPVQLCAALSAPVRWRETVLRMRADGLARFLDVGPDRVLAALVRRIDPRAEVESLQERARALA